MTFPSVSVGLTRRNLGLTLGFVVALALAGSTPANATPVQFAAFTTTSGTPFSFANNGMSANLGSSANVVNFTFSAATGLSTLNYSNVSVLFGGTTNAMAISSGAAGAPVDQAINGPTDTITFTDNNTGKVLLAITYTGDINGNIGGVQPTLSSSSNINTLTYSSQVLSSSFFNNPQSFQIGLPTSTALSIGAGGLLSSFSSANAQGQFFTSVVPQPASVAMFGTGVVAVGLLALRNRKRQPASLAMAV